MTTHNHTHRTLFSFLSTFPFFLLPENHPPSRPLLYYLCSAPARPSRSSPIFLLSSTVPFKTVKTSSVVDPSLLLPRTAIVNNTMGRTVDQEVHAAFVEFRAKEDDKVKLPYFMYLG